MIKQGTFEPDGPLWEECDGIRYPTYTCAFCGGGFPEENGKGVAWISHGMICCSETCATLYQGESPDWQFLEDERFS